MPLRMTPDELRGYLAKQGRHAEEPEPEGSPQPTRATVVARMGRWLPIALAVVVGFGLGYGDEPEPRVVETEKVVTVPGPETIVEVPVDIVSAAQEARLDRFQEQLGRLRLENRQLMEERETLRQEVAAQTSLPEDRPRCFEDEVLVRVVAQVLPDNGIDPGLDWGDGDLTGSLACYARDNLEERAALVIE